MDRQRLYLTRDELKALALALPQPGPPAMIGFRPHDRRLPPADGPPPHTLLAFSLVPVGRVAGADFAALAAALGGAADVVSAVLLGAVVDAVISTPWTRSGRSRAG